MHCIGIVESRLKVCFYSLLNVVDRGSEKLLSTKVQTIKKISCSQSSFYHSDCRKMERLKLWSPFQLRLRSAYLPAGEKLGMNSTELVYHNFKPLEDSSVIKTRAFFGQQISSFGIIFFKSIRHLQEKRRCNYVKYF